MTRLFDETWRQSCQELILVQRQEIGLRAVIALHTLDRGPCFGGIRRRPYVNESAMLADVRALASAMSLKLALAELPAGGAKAVIWDHPGLSVPEAYRYLGRRIENMGGRYTCGPDVGTGAIELGLLRGETRFVNHPDNAPSRATAAGVVAGLRGLVQGSGKGQLSDLRVAVQGLGGVGRELVQMLRAAGTRVYASDVEVATKAWAEAEGCEWVAFDDLWSIECDVFAPCAIGGLLDAGAAERLNCWGVCGAANNIVADDAALAVMRNRGIHYVPDYAVNVGAVAEGVFATTEADPTRAQVEARLRSLMDAIEQRVASAYRGASALRTMHEILRTTAFNRLFPGM